VTPELTRFSKRVFLAVMIIAAIVAVTYAIDLILLAFAGILLAILLRGAGTWLEEHSPLSIKWSMVLVLIAFAGVFLGTMWMFGVQIADQADQLFAAVSQAFSQLQQQLQQNRIASLLISGASGWSLGAPAKAVASGILWVIASIVLILFLGVYLSTDPQLYSGLFLSFFDGRLRGPGRS
jgi:predicted PurR-regulated permease PerM